MDVNIHGKYYEVQDEPEYEGLAVIDKEAKSISLFKKLSEEKPFLYDRQYVVVKIYPVNQVSNGLRFKKNE